MFQTKMPRLVPALYITLVISMFFVALLLEICTDGAFSGAGKRHRHHRHSGTSMLVGTGELVRLYITKDILFAFLELYCVAVTVVIRMLWILIVCVIE